MSKKKKYVSKDGSCPNNICPMVVHVQKMCVQGWFIDLLIYMFINEVLVNPWLLDNEMILKWLASSGKIIMNKIYLII